MNFETILASIHGLGVFITGTNNMLKRESGAIYLAIDHTIQTTNLSEDELLILNDRMQRLQETIEADKSS